MKGTAAPIKQKPSEGGRVMKQERQESSLKGKKPASTGSAMPKNPKY